MKSMKTDTPRQNYIHLSVVLNLVTSTMSGYKVVSTMPSITISDVEFAGDTPMQAAKKAFSYLVRASGRSEVKQLTFSIAKEDVIHDYVGSRVKLDEPMIVMHDGMRITIKYKNNVQSITDKS